MPHPHKKRKQRNRRKALARRKFCVHNKDQIRCDEYEPEWIRALGGSQKLNTCPSFEGGVNQ